MGLNVESIYELNGDRCDKEFYDKYDWITKATQYIFNV